MQKTERAQRTKDDAMPKTGSEKSEDGGKIGKILQVEMKILRIKIKT